MYWYIWRSVNRRLTPFGGSPHLSQPEAAAAGRGQTLLQPGRYLASAKLSSPILFIFREMELEGATLIAARWVLCHLHSQPAAATVASGADPRPYVHGNGTGSNSS